MFDILCMFVESMAGDRSWRVASSSDEERDVLVDSDPVDTQRTVMTWSPIILWLGTHQSQLFHQTIHRKGYSFSVLSTSPMRMRRTLLPHKRSHHLVPLLPIDLIGSTQVLGWNRPRGRLLLLPIGRERHPLQHRHHLERNSVEMPLGCRKYNPGGRKRIFAHNLRWGSHLLHLVLPQIILLSSLFLFQCLVPPVT